jgi:hypothetical protein
MTAWQRDDKHAQGHRVVTRTPAVAWVVSEGSWLLSHLCLAAMARSWKQQAWSRIRWSRSHVLVLRQSCEIQSTQ